MASRVVTLLALLGALALAPYTHAAVDNVVTQWLAETQRTVAALQVDNQQAGRTYGAVASVQLDAIKAAEARGLNVNAAAAFAGHAVLTLIAFWRQSGTYDVLLRNQLTTLGVTSYDEIAEYQKLVQPLALSTVTKRLRDGANLYSTWRPAAPGTIGEYQFTPGQTTVRYPQVANATGYYLSNADFEELLRPYTKHDLKSQAYVDQLQEVFDLGHVNSTVRTANQTAIARYYALSAGTSTISGYYLNVSYQVLPGDWSLRKYARFYKIFGTSVWDSGVACWRIKFRELFWRPITAIRTPHAAGPSGAPSVNDPTWAPLLSTPAHPEYTSGHTCPAGAAVWVLKKLLGNEVTWSLASEGAPDLGKWTYYSLDESATATALSRLYAGVHFQKANSDGIEVGAKVAERIFNRNFKGSFDP